MTALFKKLNFKGQAEIFILHAPDSFELEMEAIALSTHVKSKINKSAKIGFALVFVQTFSQIEKAVEVVLPQLQEDAVWWFAYPKGSSKKYVCEFNRDNGWSALGKQDFECVRMVSIDQDWSAMRFRKFENIGSFTRNHTLAISKKGKAVAKTKKR